MHILNTSFFFIPSIAPGVRTLLRDEWLAACACSGCGAPVCLKMPPEPNVERLAIQTPFPSGADAERFMSEVLAPMAGELTRKFGAEAFSCFSTIMEVTEL